MCRPQRRKGCYQKTKIRNDCLSVSDGFRHRTRHGMGDDSGAELPIQRLLTLKKDIEAKNWSLADAARERDRLSELEPEYLEALNRADPSVFERKHPELF